MLLGVNYREGSPPRMFRSISEISEDISNIKERICTAEERLDIHELMMLAVSDRRSVPPKQWINELEEVVDTARETLLELNRLKAGLTMLEKELMEVVWIRSH